jgi:hypothetical protein
MHANHNPQFETALCIVGPEDFSSDGESGSLVIEGEFATAIVQEIWNSPDYRRRHGLNGQPVRLSRLGGLEIWCNGAYTEGRGVRGIIHRAVRTLQHKAQSAANSRFS